MRARRSGAAIAAGCRLMFAYPITPSSEIMEQMIKRLPEFGGTVVQTEDEIAAISMVIGANYGGVRAFTASAGPEIAATVVAVIVALGLIATALRART